MLVFGLITGLFVLCTSGLQYQISDKLSTDLNTKTEQSEDAERSETVITAFDALSQTVNVQVINPILLSFGDIPENEREEATELPYMFKGVNRYFKTLFRLIIAPNAP